MMNVDQTQTPGKPRELVAPELKPLLKPRDIPLLELSQLQEMNSVTRLNLFFNSVERCAQNSLERLQIAELRMGLELTGLIHSARESGRIGSWEEFKTFMLEEFQVKLDFQQTWQRASGMTYDWRTSPQAFVHKFKCFFASLKGNFPQQTLPSRDKMIKQKLVDGFPPTNRNALTPFMDGAVTIDDFLTHVQHQRTLLEYAQVQVRILTERGSCENSQSCPSDSNSRESGTPELRKLNSQLNKLENMLTVTPIKRPNVRQYCQFCRSNNHRVESCPNKYLRGKCFDCQSPNCRRGRPECPGRKFVDGGSSNSNWRTSTPVAKPQSIVNSATNQNPPTSSTSQANSSSQA